MVFFVANFHHLATKKGADKFNKGILEALKTKLPYLGKKES
jgi:hypothetical protein